MLAKILSAIGVIKEIVDGLKALIDAWKRIQAVNEYKKVKKIEKEIKNEINNPDRKPGSISSRLHEL